MRNKEEFLKKYETLCKEYKMCVHYADECGYYLETTDLYYFKDTVDIQIKELKGIYA